MSNKDFGRDDVEILNRTKSHDGFIKVDTLTIRHRLYAGGWSKEIPRELIRRPHAVGVLLFDPDRDEVVLVRQIRVGMLEEPGSPWMLELVAGMVDAQESFAEVAHRESQEEANLAPSELVLICDYYNSPGVSNERVIVYCGKVDASGAGGVYGLAQEHEDIEVVVMSTNEAIAAVTSGTINNAMSVIALQWLELNREKLRVQWREK